MLRFPLKSTLVLGALALVAVLWVRSASAGGGDDRCYSRYCASVYCDHDDDRCYRPESRDYDRRDYDRDEGRYEVRRDRDGYRDSNWRGDYRRMHYACDSDGDRCYPSTSRYWDYREYYRRHGYHWQN